MRVLTAERKRKSRGREVERKREIGGGVGSTTNQMEERGQRRDWVERRSSHSNPSAPIDQDEMKGAWFSNLDDNLIFEVFKHVDARTLGMASCALDQHWLRQPAAEICGPHSRRVPAASRPLHLASQQDLILFQLRPFFLVGGVLLYFALGDSSGEADVELEAVERSVGKGRGEFVALIFLDLVLQEDELRSDRMGVNRKRTEE
ncbi:hypothetical protein ACFX13_000874 [Malus domestica]